MRRLWLMTGAILAMCHLALGGIVISGRLNDAAVCLQYRTYNNAEAVFGVIDANSGTTLIDRGRNNWTYLYTNERYSIAAKRHNMGFDMMQNQPYATYDLALTASDPFLTGRRTFTPLQEGILIPIPSTQLADTVLYQFLSNSLIVAPGQLAFRWLDQTPEHTFHGILTLVNEDGSNHREVELDPSIGMSSPIAWSADARYLLMRTEQATRYQPYAVFDVQSLKAITLPSALRLPDASWQTAVWSPTHAQLAAIRPAHGDVSDTPSMAAPLQLVLFSPADGTTQIVDLPPHFFAQEIVWSPNGKFGMLVGIQVASEQGISSGQDAKAYLVFSAAGNLTSGIIEGLGYPELQGRIAIRLGTWTVDGNTWLYLRKKTVDPSKFAASQFFELVAVNSLTLTEQVVEDRLAPEWWAEVFSDSSASARGFGATPPAFRQDIVLVIRNANARLDLDLLDTQTMKRSRLVADADRLTAARGTLSNGGQSAFRLPLYQPNATPSIIFDALVKKNSELRYVWSTLDGSNHYELPIEADAFEINSGWVLQQPTLIYRLKRGDQSNIGKIEVDTGVQRDLLKSLTFLADNFNVILSSSVDRVAFTTTNILTGPADLYLSALDGSFTKLVDKLILPDPVWSPDGSQLAYMKIENGRFVAVVIDRDGNPVRTLTTNIKLTQNFQGLYLRGWTKCPQ